MNTFVQVPRKVFTEAIWSLSWEELRAKASQGECGLALLEIPKKSLITRDVERLRYGVKKGDIYTWIDVANDVAVMREGMDGIHKGRALLHGQNW